MVEILGRCHNVPSGLVGDLISLKNPKILCASNEAIFQHVCLVRIRGGIQALSRSMSLNGSELQEMSKKIEDGIFFQPAKLYKN